MQRRDFIRIVGGASVVTAMAPNYVFANGTLSSDGVLLEACTFKNPLRHTRQPKSFSL